MSLGCFEIIRDLARDYYRRYRRLPRTPAEGVHILQLEYRYRPVPGPAVLGDLVISGDHLGIVVRSGAKLALRHYLRGHLVETPLDRIRIDWLLRGF